MVTGDDIRAIALDLDGTLAGADHVVHPRALRALTVLEQRGIRPIIVTGRTTHAAEIAWRASHLSAPVISCNGAVVADLKAGAILFERTMEPAQIADVLDVAHVEGLVASLWTPTHIYAESPHPLMDLLAAINQEPIMFVPLTSLAGTPIVKAMLGGPVERLDEVESVLRARLPRMRRSLPEFYEESQRDTGKGVALRFVLERLGVQLSECMAIGDSDTDLEMFSICDFSVAVSNARPNVRNAADRVIGHHDEDGVAIFLEQFFNVAAG